MRAALFGLAGGVLHGVRADVVTLGSVSDNSLIFNATGAVSNGAGTVMLSGANGQVEARRAAVRFAVADSIPAGSRIEHVELHLVSSSATTNSQECTLHRLLTSWGEAGSFGAMGQGGGAPAEPGDVTWLHRFYPDVFWSAPGGDFVSSASAATTVSMDGPSTWVSAQMVSDVQFWLDHPESDFGWLIRGDETLARTNKRFSTREEPSESMRPRLAVQFDACPADLNGDDAVDDADFVLFAVAYNLFDCADPSMGPTCEADLNGDGVVDDADFVVFVAAYDTLVCS